MILNLQKKICIIGSGGLAKEVYQILVDCLKNQEINHSNFIYFMVKDEDFKEEEIMGLTTLPQSKFHPKEYNVIAAIGDPKIREEAIHRLPISTNYLTLIHPNTVISKWVTIGEGSVIAAGCILTTHINIGKFAYLNMNTTVGHDCIMGDFFTTAPGSNINGNCHFGDRIYVGSNASIKQGITITSDVTLGIGSVVLRNIDEKGTYFGNPVRKFS